MDDVRAGDGSVWRGGMRARAWCNFLRNIEI